MVLCIVYTDLSNLERAVKNASDDKNRKFLFGAYENQKKIFDEQYQKIEDNINKNLAVK